ncbi:MAG TPA: HYR domain-containing protein, partial [Candidatus Binatia bacterium]|nr:HYR domain-containing protein [Candidatus Binatia bacterium]
MKMRNLTRYLTALAAGTVLNHSILQCVAQQGTNVIQGPFVSVRVEPLVMTNDLRTLPKALPWQPGDPIFEIEDLEEEEPPIPLRHDQSRTRRGKTTLTGAFNTPRTAAAPGSGAGLLVNFDGVPNSLVGGFGIIPPDTVGDVGPNHYIQAVNMVFSIYDKQGTLLVGPSPINSLWSGFGGPCESQNSGDPMVQYDHLADRWIISQFTLPAANHQCFAVSRTGDPVTGGWFLYDFTTPSANDFPKLAVWPDAYYMSSQRNMFPGGGVDVYAFDRTSMLAGAPASFVQFFVPAPALVLLPADLDGPPPGATPNLFARQVDGDMWGGIDRVEMFSFSVNWSNPGLSTFTALPSLATAPFDSVLCSGGLISPCVPQPGVATTLETLTVWPMWRLQYRNFGTHETLVFNHTVDADGADHAGIRWYELRRSGGSGWSIFQQGTHAPDGGSPGLADDVHRWMGSIAMDAGGNIALAYSVSSGTVYPGIRYAGRLAGDPLGVMTLPEVTIVSGAGSQTDGSGRWGDYSTLTVDPVDECKFWFTSEYYATTSQGGWTTRIAAFTLDSVPPVITCPASVVRPTDPGLCSAMVNYTVTAIDNCLDATVTCAPPSGSVFPKGVTTVNCTATDTASNSSTCSFTVVVEDREAPHVNCPVNIVVANDPGQCSAVVTYTTTAADNCPGVSVVCAPASGSVFPKGTSSVACTATDASGNKAQCGFTVTVLDKEPPTVACEPGPNPSGKKIPSAGKNPRSGQNPDGFYKVLSKDNCDPRPKIYVKDSRSSFVAGPFANGANLKIVQTPGGRPRQQPGPGVVVAHITLRGDALVYAVDADGN